MRVFVTGATGFVGTAVVGDLLAAGHEVTGLARSGEAAAALAAAGARAHRGDLRDAGSLRDGAAAADGVIHLAMLRDPADPAAGGRTDAAAIEAIGAALARTGRRFVVASALLGLTPGRVGTEQDVPGPGSPAAARLPAENAALALAGRGVRSSVVRLPPSVHGPGDAGLVPRLIALARERGVSAYAGGGTERWTAVHRLDAARLFRLALETAPAGARLHGAAEAGVAVRAIAGAIGRGLGLPVTGLSGREADAHFGHLASFLRIDSPVASALTRQRVGWRPERPGLIADLDGGHYFAAAAAR
jgi:nucleoside-diphosphate-sugar epimerase